MKFEKFITYILNCPRSKVSSWHNSYYGSIYFPLSLPERYCLKEGEKVLVQKAGLNGILDKVSEKLHVKWATVFCSSTIEINNLLKKWHAHRVLTLSRSD